MLVLFEYVEHPDREHWELHHMEWTPPTISGYCSGGNCDHGCSAGDDSGGDDVLSLIPGLLLTNDTNHVIE